MKLFSNMFNILKHSQKQISTLAKKYIANYSEDSNGCQQPSACSDSKLKIADDRIPESTLRFSKTSEDFSTVFCLLRANTLYS